MQKSGIYTTFSFLSSSKWIMDSMWLRFNYSALGFCLSSQISEKCSSKISQTPPNKLASSKLRSQSETMTHSPTHLLTVVKCRATSVAKNLKLLWKYYSYLGLIILSQNRANKSVVIKISWLQTHYFQLYQRGGWIHKVFVIKKREKRAASVVIKRAWPQTTDVLMPSLSKK